MEEFDSNKQQIMSRVARFIFFLHSVAEEKAGREGGKLIEHGGEVERTGQKKKVTCLLDGCCCPPCFSSLKMMASS